MRTSLPQPSSSNGGLAVPTFFHEDEEDDEVESMGLLNKGGSEHRGIAFFEIDQARQGSQRRRRQRGGNGRGKDLVSFCAAYGCLHWSLTFSVVANVVVGLILLVQLSNGRSLDISTGFLPTRGHTASNHSDVIYGHVHIVKTAGTTINGMLASGYDNVCGSKGYSLDYYEYNERVRNSTDHDVRKVTMDSISNQTNNNPMMNRGRVPFDIIQEIGFQNCDYMSLEHSWEIWPQLRQSLPKRFKLELHVPCHDPLDHLMSMCLYRNWDFDCRSNDLEAEIEACVFGMDRFSLQLETLPNVELKCFSPIPVEPYIQYMQPFLQARRIPAVYVHRDSDGAGGPRDEIIKGEECLGWYPHIADQVQTMLLEKYDYYHWCDECLGLSANDLLF